jgi:hypothetical protein
MLGKLLKYEIKASGVIMPALYAGLALVFCLGLLAKTLNIIQIQGAMAVACVLVGIAALVLALVMVVTRYHKSLFGAEGYLMQTLPVKKGSLILSKAISGYILILLGLGALVLGIAGTVYLTGAGELAEQIKSLFGGQFSPLLVFFGAAMLIQLFLMVSEVYFSITLANTSPFLKNNVLFAVVFYFVVNMVAGVLELVAMMVLPLGIKLTGDGHVQWVFETTLGSLIENPSLTGQQDLSVFSEISLGVGSIAVDLILGIALLLVARWLMTRKTSVK